MRSKNQLEQLFNALNVENKVAVQQFFDHLPDEYMAEYVEKLERKRSLSSPSSNFTLSLGGEEEKIFHSNSPEENKSDSRTAAGSGVLSGAFHSVQAVDVMMPEEEKEFFGMLEALYQSDPIYTWESTLSVPLSTFTLEHRSVARTKFKAQMEILSKKLFGDHVSIAIPNFYKYENEYGHQIPGDTDMVRFQIDYYYKTVKEKLEQIYFFCNKSADTSMKKMIIDDLKTGIKNCGPGIPGHVNHTLNKLIMGKAPRVSVWLAELRKGILDQWVASKIARQGESFEVHFFTAAYQVSVEKGWNISGADDMANVADTYADRRRQNLGTEFQEYFQEKYTREKIIDCVANRLEQALKEVFPGTDRYFAYSYDLVNVLGSIFPDHLKYHLNYFLDESRTITVGSEKRYYLKSVDFNEIAEEILVEQGAIADWHSTVAADEKARISRVLDILRAEKLRLECEQLNVAPSRCRLLEDVIDRIGVIATDRTGNKSIRIAVVIKKELLSGAQVTLQERHWAEKLGLVVLNVLMAIPLCVPALIKYMATGSAFFSLAPRKVYVEEFHLQADKASRVMLGRA